VDRLNNSQTTATRVAVRNFTLGPMANQDDETKESIPSWITHLYVTDKTTVLNTAEKPIGTAPWSSFKGIIALGDVDVTGFLAGSKIFTDAIGVTLATTSTLTSSKGGISITIPSYNVISNGSGNAPSIRVDEGKDFTILLDATPPLPTLALYQLKGPGTLTVGNAPGDISIIGGNGNIKFLTAIIISTKLQIGSTGKTSFDDSLTVTGAGASNQLFIMGDAAFKEDVTRTSGQLTFGGDVYLSNGKSLVLTDDKDLILSKGSTIYVGETPVLTTAVGAALTPIADTTLTGGPKPTSATPNAAAIAASKTLTLSSGGLTITDGSLEVVGGEDDADKGIFAIGTGTVDGDASVATKKTSTTNGTLSIAKGGTLSLAYYGGDTKITIGNTVIAPPNGTKAATLSASGGAVTLGDNLITGSGATLIAANSPSFTVDDANGGANLNITGVNLNLAAGSLVIKGNNTVEQTVSLVDQAKITLNNLETSAANTRTKIKGGASADTGTAVISENAEKIGATDGKNAKIVSLGHTTGGDVVITGAKTSGADITLNKSSAFID
jgi:hypothetical protein